MVASIPQGIAAILGAYEAAITWAVPYQTSSWSVEQFFEQDTRRDHEIPTVKEMEESFPGLVSARNTIRDKNRARQQQAREMQQEDDDAIIWDEVGDITGYFDELIRYCSEKHMKEPSQDGGGGTGDEVVELVDDEETGEFEEDETGERTSEEFEDLVVETGEETDSCGIGANEMQTQTQSYGGKCFDYLVDLIEKPRCTVRLDSRHECKRNVSASPPPREPSGTAESVLTGTFLESTINVVIIGAGPVGLYLANLLADQNWIGDLPPIRVVVFENRVDGTAIGRKQPYTRSYMTSLHLWCFQVIDEFSDLVDTLFPGGLWNLPINAIETLLLLSGRRRGVQFLYDDYRKYESIISNLPNVIAFDASGHRLDRLGGRRKDAYASREANVHTPRDGVNQTQLLFPSKDFESTYFTVETYDLQQKHGKVISVAEAETEGGTILYPVNADGSPHTYRFLKVSNLKIDRDEEKIINTICNDINADKASYEEFKYLQDQFCLNKYVPYCEDVCRDFMHNCHAYCGKQSYWTAKYYREDIHEWIGTNQHHDISIAMAVIHLSPEEYDVLDYILPSNTDVPIDDVLGVDFSKLDAMRFPVDALATLSHLSLGENTTVNLFSYEPFMYKNPRIPTKIFGGVPFLRIGDSIFSGSPNLGNSLTRHLEYVYNMFDEGFTDYLPLL